VEFSDKKTGERVRLGVDFVRLLAAGETISTAAVTASVLQGTDATPSALLDGAAVIDGETIWQEVDGGVVGVYYTLEFTATTSLGHVFIERATLEVKA
jgi:hypothetical protein